MAKEFIAYKIIHRLEANNEVALLQQLSEHVEAARKANKKQHEICETSFDWKDCRRNKFA